MLMEDVLDAIIAEGETMSLMDKKRAFLDKKSSFMASMTTSESEIIARESIGCSLLRDCESPSEDSFPFSTSFLIILSSKHTDNMIIINVGVYGVRT